MNYLTTSKVAAYLAIIFMAGGAAGVVIMRSTREQPTQAPSVEKACHKFQDRLISKLGLTQEQIRKLQPVFDQTVQNLRAAHARAMHDTEEVIRKAHDQIARELTPEQKTRLDQFDQERQEWLRHRLEEQGDSISP